MPTTATIASPPPDAPPAAPALSFSASSCLMQDALPGNVLPAREGVDVPNQLAPFPNPFHGWKEEMVFIGADEKLHHLFRDDESGWREAPITNANRETYAAAEVVTIVSDVDRSILAIFADPAGKIGCLRLTAPVTSGKQAVWDRILVVEDPSTSFQPPVPNVRA